MKSLIILILLVRAIQCVDTDKTNFDRVSSCVLSGLSAMAHKKRPAPDRFHLHYEDNAFEIFHAIRQDEIKKVELLKSCVQVEDPSSFFVSDTDTFEGGNYYGNSNITYLTGVFQSLLPEVYKSLLTTIAPYFKKTDWDVRFDQLGVRSVRYLSYNKGNMTEYRRMLTQEKKQAEEKNPFVIASTDTMRKIEKEKTMLEKTKYDRDADDVVRNYIRPGSGTTYTALIMLSDRRKCVGGSILVNSQLSESNNKLNADTPEDHLLHPHEHAYDRDEEDEDQYDVHEDETDLMLENIETHPQYHAMSAIITRYTPDQGSLLFIDRRFEYGIQEVVVGKRDLLEIEFWPYEDAKYGSGRPTLQEAVPIINHSKEEL
eukprot:gene7794-10588_t